MNAGKTIDIYRIYNTSGEPLSFETRQGFKISLPPGGAIDLGDFEIEESESFTEIDNPDKIQKLVGQSFSVGEDPDLLEEIKRGVLESRGIASSKKPRRRKKTDAQTSKSDTAAEKKKRKPRKKRGKKGGDTEA